MEKEQDEVEREKMKSGEERERKGGVNKRVAQLKMYMAGFYVG